MLISVHCLLELCSVSSGLVNKQLFWELIKPFTHPFIHLTEGYFWRKVFFPLSLNQFLKQCKCKVFSFVSLNKKYHWFQVGFYFYLCTRRLMFYLLGSLLLTLYATNPKITLELELNFSLWELVRAFLFISRMSLDNNAFREQRRAYYLLISYYHNKSK